MFDFTVCMLSNPAPPPFTVSKYASVTLPLKPVLCDKGCMLKGDWYAKSPWAPVPSVSRVLTRSPPPVTCKTVVWHTSDQLTPGQTWPSQNHPCLSEPCGNLISERGKCVNNRLSFLKVMAIQGRISFFSSCATMKRSGFCCFISADLQGQTLGENPSNFPLLYFPRGTWYNFRWAVVEPSFFCGSYTWQLQLITEFLQNPLASEGQYYTLFDSLRLVPA